MSVDALHRRPGKPSRYSRWLQCTCFPGGSTLRLYALFPRAPRATSPCPASRATLRNCPGSAVRRRSEAAPSASDSTSPPEVEQSGRTADKLQGGPRLHLVGERREREPRWRAGTQRGGRRAPKKTSSTELERWRSRRQLFGLRGGRPTVEEDVEVGGGCPYNRLSRREAIAPADPGGLTLELDAAASSGTACATSSAPPTATASSRTMWRPPSLPDRGGSDL
jgi:hypothetical protein